MEKPSETTFDPANLLAKSTPGVKRHHYREKAAIFSQDALADSVFYVEQGRVKRTFSSSSGKERVIAIHGPGEFFGLGCVIGRSTRRLTAAAMTSCMLLQIEKSAMIRLLHDHPGWMQALIAFLVGRNSHYQEDLLDHLLNSSELRLARTLLHLAEVDQENADAVTIAKISQETLAEIVGTTRSRVNHFMNKFRKLGLIEYRGKICVHRRAINVYLSHSGDS
jgi:CRP/FNR family transcriptional regulator, cyclic AMP receptor protein